MKGKKVDVTVPENVLIHFNETAKEMNISTNDLFSKVLKYGLIHLEVSRSDDRKLLIEENGSQTEITFD